MRLLHVTDLHLQRRWFDWVATEANHYEAVCISGDFLLDGGDEPHEQQLRFALAWLTELHARMGDRLFLCSGNHDIDLQPVNDEGPLWLSQGPWVAEGRAGHLAEWEVLTQPFLGARPAQYAPHASARRILISHAQPADCLPARDENEEDHGDPLVLWFQADLHLCGHVHQPARRWERAGRTFVCNPGCDFSAPIPEHAVIDLAAARVTFHSARRPREMVRIAEQ